MFRCLLTIIVLIVSTPQPCCGGCSQSVSTTASSQITTDTRACPYCSGSRKSGGDSQKSGPCSCARSDIRDLFSNSSGGELLPAVPTAIMNSNSPGLVSLRSQFTLVRSRQWTDFGPPLRVILQRFLL